MFESFSASGFFVHTPCGPRKSGIPDSVEIPAPVNATTRVAAVIHEATSATSSITVCYGATENGTAAITLSHINASRPPLSDISMKDHVIWSIENGSDVIVILVRTTSLAGV